MTCCTGHKNAIWLCSMTSPAPCQAAPCPQQPSTVGKYSVFLIRPVCLNAEVPVVGDKLRAKRCQADDSCGLQPNQMSANVDLQSIRSLLLFQCTLNIFIAEFVCHASHVLAPSKTQTAGKKRCQLGAAGFC